MLIKEGVSCVKALGTCKPIERISRPSCTQLIEIDLVKEEPEDNKPEEDDVTKYIEPDEGELLVI